MRKNNGEMTILDIVLVMVCAFLLVCVFPRFIPDFNSQKTAPTSTPAVLMVTPSPAPSASPSGVISEKSSLRVMSGAVLAADVFTQVNHYRATQGLESFTMSRRTCNFAYTRAMEIAKDFSHNGFFRRSAASAMPYAGYATENLARADVPSYDVVNAWISSPLHHANLIANTPEVCIMRFASSGKMYYAMEGLRAN